ncbi:XdhC family protein [Oricola thermophila]|uniref:XdhC family protein n=1 Tax=Oricola thermophila TaxID=2742145 RepID=A0A6N1VBJ6_9HYPH|nr:XdhC family protein [Oricola thermophila]QKV18058.1 XdhC family protein [Oricola thermophila]
MDPHSLKRLNSARAARRAVALVTEMDSGRDRVVEEGDLVAGDLGEALAKAFRTGKSGMVEIEGGEFFINVHLPPPRLVVIGAVHISQAMAPMARLAGYDIEIIDPRTAFATPERFEGFRLDAEWPETVLRDRPLDRYCALCAITHDPKIDDFPLKAALAAECFYVGALGSRKTHGKRVERLLAEGLTQQQIDRIAAPIGLDIGASSPAEIAVAILAQVIEAFRKREIAGGSVSG